MKNFFQILLLAVLPITSMLSQPIKAKMLSNWRDNNQVIVPWINGRYSEVWGFAVNNHEFAVLGSTGGMHLIDVTEPVTPKQVVFVPGASQGNFVVHRDFKTFNGHLYCVADEGSTAKLQIIDIQNVRA